MNTKVSSTDSLEQFAFTFPTNSVSKSVDPKGKQFGSVVLERQEYISQWCNKIQAIDDSSHHYWRGPKGSGKTTFLLLLGKELQNRNLSVYYLKHAGYLGNITEVSVNNTIANNDKIKKRTVLMIDEAHENVNAPIYICLLRECRTLIILATGISRISSYSVTFDHKHDPYNIFLQESEVEDFADVWYHHIESKFKKCNRRLADIIKFCEWLRLFTGGLMYPMVAICEHMFSDGILEKHFELYQLYLTSAEFYCSAACMNIKSRCFDAQNVALFKKILSHGELLASNVLELETLGYWASDEGSCLSGWFVSDFILYIAYNWSTASPSLDLDWCSSLSVSEKIEALIIMGLRNMTESDFFEGVHLDSVKLENAFAFCWGREVHTQFPSVIIAPQTRANSGKPPTVDYKFNGPMSIAIELSKNHHDIKRKLKKFAIGGIYNQWIDRFAILNFQINSTSTLSLEKNVYHFVKENNTLYNGDRVVCAGVVRCLQTPPHLQHYISPCNNSLVLAEQIAFHMQMCNSKKKPWNVYT